MRKLAGQSCPPKQTNTNEGEQKEQIVFPIHPYQPEDYETCEALVNQAWSYDAIFRTKGVSRHRQIDIYKVLCYRRQLQSCC
ncbi:MAG: hypothetical protein ACWA44_12895 [Thiotrichales bacterium]